MPRGDKSKYTDKQIRKAHHIEDSYKEQGLSEDEAERRAWSTVNKDSGGGNKSGAGRGVPDTTASERKARTRSHSSNRKTG
jgi:plasmid stabilization system protein ParE